MPNNRDDLLLLDHADVARLLQPDMVSEAVRHAFALHAARQGRVFPVIREALPTGGVFGIKAGDVPGEALLGFKAAGFWPANRARGGEPHQATVMLVDPATGRPRCLADGNLITTERTGAAGALGLSLLARPDSRSLCVFGTGVQARVQIKHALRVLPKIERVTYLSSQGQPAAAFEAALSGMGVTVQHATDANLAVASADVVITATPGRQILFDAQAVTPGTHVNAVGADTRGKRELPEGLLAVATVVVDDLAQARSLGEAQWAPSLSAVELGDLLTGGVAYTRRDSEITVFDLTGLALQDLTVGQALLREATAQGVGTRVPWHW